MKFIILTIVTTALLGVYATAQDSQSIAQAKTAASTWLALVDAGKYSDSWEQSAGVRAPLGALASRKIQSSTFTHTLPGAPDGNYVVIKYTS